MKSIKEHENFETIARNVADVLINFETDYKRYEGETLEEHMQEFGVQWLEGAKERNEEWVIAFGSECLFDGFKSEREADEAFTVLENRAYEIANEINEK